MTSVISFDSFRLLPRVNRRQLCHLRCDDYRSIARKTSENSRSEIDCRSSVLTISRQFISSLQDAPRRLTYLNHLSTYTYAISGPRNDLVIALLFTGCTRKITLRITVIQDEPSVITLKIEGRVTGATIVELNRTWRDLALSLGSRKLSVNLCGVTFMDAAGRNVLAEIHSETSADFVADTPMTKYFAEEAKQGIRLNVRRET
jgi:hypothetical protein